MRQRAFAVQVPLLVEKSWQMNRCGPVLLLVTYSRNTVAVGQAAGLADWAKE
jgi:hypothetical protein